MSHSARKFYVGSLAVRARDEAQISDATDLEVCVLPMNKKHMYRSCSHLLLINNQYT